VLVDLVVVVSGNVGGISVPVAVPGSTISFPIDVARGRSETMSGFLMRVWFQNQRPRSSLAGVVRDKRQPRPRSPWTRCTRLLDRGDRASCAPGH